MSALVTKEYAVLVRVNVLADSAVHASSKVLSDVVTEYVQERCILDVARSVAIPEDDAAYRVEMHGVGATMTLGGEPTANVDVFLNDQLIQLRTALTSCNCPLCPPRWWTDKDTGVLDRAISALDAYLKTLYSISTAHAEQDRQLQAKLGEAVDKVALMYPHSTERAALYAILSADGDHPPGVLEQAREFYNRLLRVFNIVGITFPPTPPRCG